ncbi:hypothetical protein [Rhizobium leguminosarum]|nr:hypothetical protein [Rhizobium leguminosarum]
MIADDGILAAARQPAGVGKVCRSLIGRPNKFPKSASASGFGN